MSRAASAISRDIAYIDRRRTEKQDAERIGIETALFLRKLDAKLDTLIHLAAANRGEARDVIRAHQKAYVKECNKAHLAYALGEEAKHTPTAEQERRALEVAAQLPAPKRLQRADDPDTQLHYGDALREYYGIAGEYGRHSEEANDAARVVERVRAGERVLPTDVVASFDKLADEISKTVGGGEAMS